MARALVLVVLVLAAAGCAGLESRAYYPPPGDTTRRLAEMLFRVAQAAGDDPTRYSFALLASRHVATYSADDDATFYLSEGLVREPPAVIEALLAREVAHEVLGHAGQRRALSWSITAGFTVLGIAVPGAGLLDFAVNPLVVRAFTRDQVIAADLRALEILRTLGHASPRQALGDALRAAHAVNGPARTGPLATEPTLDERLAALGLPSSSPAAARTPASR
jgi:Zn-dependent protease with chaperone function